MADIKDRRLRIGIDSNDLVRFLHTGAVLNGAGYPAGNIKFGAYGNTGLAHLPFMRNKSGIDCRPASRHLAVPDLQDGA